MDPNLLGDLWLDEDDAGVGSDGELRCVLEKFCGLPSDTGVGFQERYGNDGCCLDQTSTRKRAKGETCPGTKSKACREKMRRNKLNDRFSELSSVLDPGRPPRSDKSSILSDTVHLLVKLKNEAEQLKESNEKLQETIKELKVEKNELRDEKTRLKSEKGRLEQQVKAMSLPPPGFMPHPIPMAFHPSVTNKGTPAYPAAFPNPSMGMWQWLPPTVLDTTQDAKLWSPNA